jgi:hypothetical protein
MRVTSVVFGTMLATAALALAGCSLGAPGDDGPGAGAAAARQHQASFSVAPRNAAAGEQVTLTAPGCATPATASSSLFGTVTIPLGSSGTARVDVDAPADVVYSVTFTCGGQTGTADLTITGGGMASAAAPTAAVPQPVPSVVPSSTLTSPAFPQGVNGGVGGSAATLDVLTIATGVGLALTSAIGALWVMRRRSS